MLNQIFNEDCLIGMKRIPDKSVDMILCDLPYGMGDNGSTWDKVIPLDLLWKEYKRIIKDNGAIVLTASQPFTTDLVISNRKQFRYTLVWQKSQGTGFLNANRMPIKAHEDILVFYKKLPTYNPQKTPGKPYTTNNTKKTTNKHRSQYTALNKDFIGTPVTNLGDRYPISIIEFKQEKGLHPTQKPVALFEWLIKTYTNEGMTVLDNCMGSGTTAIACLNTNRNYIGFELDPDFYQTATNRIKEWHDNAQI